jgi:Ca2+-binding EF-hand superfamily protein
MDDRGTGTIDYAGFRKVIKDYQLGFTEDELKALFKEFDISHSGTIDYDELIVIVRVLACVDWLGQGQRAQKPVDRAGLSEAGRGGARPGAAERP